MRRRLTWNAAATKWVSASEAGFTRDPATMTSLPVPSREGNGRRWYREAKRAWFRHLARELKLLSTRTPGIDRGHSVSIMSND